MPRCKRFSDEKRQLIQVSSKEGMTCEISFNCLEQKRMCGTGKLTFYPNELQFSTIISGA